MWVRAIVGTGVAAGLMLCGASTAAAFCLSSVCDDGSNGILCSPSEEGDCDGPTLRWPKACLGFSVQIDGSAQVNAKTAQTLARQAFATWENAECGPGLTPNFHAVDLGKVPCDRLEYNKAAANANIIVFRDRKWPHPDDSHSVALTTTTYDPKTGLLLDADIEINTENFVITTTDATENYDLLSVLTHEVGHFLGLAHTGEPDATMFRIYQPGTVELRSLHPDDNGAICTAYAATESKDLDCNPLPRHGFSPECAADQTEGSCRAAPPVTPKSGGWWALALALVALPMARRSNKSIDRWHRVSR